MVVDRSSKPTGWEGTGSRQKRRDPLLIKHEVGGHSSTRRTKRGVKKTVFEKIKVKRNKGKRAQRSGGRKRFPEK